MAFSMLVVGIYTYVHVLWCHNNDEKRRTWPFYQNHEIIGCMILGSCLVIHHSYLLLVQQKITPSPAELSQYAYPSVSKKKIANHVALETEKWDWLGRQIQQVFGSKRLQDKVYLAHTDKHTHLRSSIPPAQSFLVNTQLFMCPSSCLIHTYLLIFFKGTA